MDQAKREQLATMSAKDRVHIMREAIENIRAIAESLGLHPPVLQLHPHNFCGSISDELRACASKISPIERDTNEDGAVDTVETLELGSRDIYIYLRNRIIAAETARRPELGLAGYTLGGDTGDRNY